MPKLIVRAILASFFCVHFNQSAYALDWNELENLSLEQLAALEVTSLDKVATPLKKSAASFYVIDAGEIRRSGARTLIEALYLAPNLHVARFNARETIVGTRGFFEGLSNKLQVMIDGRIVYSPLYAAVFWDVQDLLVDDIKQIEVISGPADVSWGANAVNGVINIVTYSAFETKSNIIDASVGTMQNQLGFRHRSQVGDNTALRVYGKNTYSDGSELANGQNRDDGWWRQQLGFRLDRVTVPQSLQVQGDLYYGHLGPESNPGFDRGEVSGGNLLANWTKKYGESEDLNVLSYFDFTHRLYSGFYEDDLATVYVEANRSLIKANHFLLMGIDYRHSQHTSSEFPFFQFEPSEKNLNWYSVFFRDKWSVSEQLLVNMGLRIEENPYTGIEYMPTLRTLWSFNSGSVIWAALSRNIRSPSRIDTDVRVPSQPPYIFMGNENFQSEVARNIQLGWKGLISTDVHLDITAFRALHDDLHTFNVVDGRPLVTNDLKATVTGLEFWLNAHVNSHLKIKYGSILLDEDFYFTNGSIPVLNFPENAPTHQSKLQVQWNVSANTELDMAYTYASSLNAFDIPDKRFLDLRYAWWPQKNIEVSVKGSNILNSSQAEYTNADGIVSYFGREITFGFRWYSNS